MVAGRSLQPKKVCGEVCPKSYLQRGCALTAMVLALAWVRSLSVWTGPPYALALTGTAAAADILALADQCMEHRCPRSFHMRFRVARSRLQLCHQYLMWNGVLRPLHLPIVALGLRQKQAELGWRTCLQGWSARPTTMAPSACLQNIATNSGWNPLGAI